VDCIQPTSLCLSQVATQPSFQVAPGEGGSTRALQPQELYRSQRYATAIYQAELGYRIQQLGYGIETGKNGAPEILQQRVLGGVQSPQPAD
jgi:hypothetical protein